MRSSVNTTQSENMTPALRATDKLTGMCRGLNFDWNMEEDHRKNCMYTDLCR